MSWATYDTRTISGRALEKIEQLQPVVTMWFKREDLIANLSFDSVTTEIVVLISCRDDRILPMRDVLFNRIEVIAGGFDRIAQKIDAIVKRAKVHHTVVGALLGNTSGRRYGS